jgi:rhamnosyltransferase
MSNQSPKKIAVLVAAYNGKQWVGKQIQSILMQAKVEVTLFISVDRSDDGTEEFIDQLSLGENRIRILPHGKKFGGAGPNFYRLSQEVNLSGFDYVAFADQDDIWFSNKLLRACEELARAGADGYSSNVTAFWANGRQLLINKSQPQVRWDFLFEAAGPGCTYVISNKLACELQRFINQHAQNMPKIDLHDWFIYAFARLRGFKWTIDHESHMLYRQHAGNIVGANVGFKAKFQRLKKAREGWLFNQAILIAEILGYSTQKPIEKIKRLHFKDRLWLILNARQLRRRLLDQFAFAFLVLIYIKK